MAAQRRKRYVCTYLQGSERKIIHLRVYGSIADARALALEHGIRPLSIRPYRKGENVKVEAPFRLNVLNLRQAERELGLKWPVRYKLSGHKGGRRGVHEAHLDASGRPYHLVKVKDYIGAEQASKTLWHELRHCEQSEEMCERRGILPGGLSYALAWDHEYRGITEPNQKRGTRYLGRQWEVEARATERNADRLALAR